VSGVCGVSYVETIRTVQRPKTPIGIRKAGPQKTTRQKILRSEKEAAAGRASSRPDSGQGTFETKQRSGQVRVKDQAAGRASSC